METLLETLGTEATYRFLKFALPQFEQRSQELLNSLHAGNWENAASCAHKLKGTIHLYSSPTLQEMLQQIAAGNDTNIRDGCFLAKLGSNLTASTNKINLFLSNS